MIPLAIASHPHLGPILAGSVTPGVEGGFTSTSMLVILGAAALMIAVSFGLGYTPLHGQFSDAGARQFLRVRRRVRPSHSLHHRLGDAKLFHGSYAATVLLAAGIVLIPGAPLGTITTAVQALAGVLRPSATVFLLLLCNDKAVLGPRTNPGWLNAIASLIVGVLVILSAVLTVTTLCPLTDRQTQDAVHTPFTRYAHT